MKSKKKGGSPKKAEGHTSARWSGLKKPKKRKRKGNVIARGINRGQVKFVAKARDRVTEG